MSASETDIAVIGISLHVPGAATPDEFWRNLSEGVESIRRYTKEELIEAGERPDLIARPNYVPAGAPLEGMSLFDSEFFGFSPKEAAILDPQHRHFMECAWEAMEDAGHTPESFGGPIGVFAGCGMGSYFYFNLCSRAELVDDVGMFLLRHTGNDKDFLSTRVSYLFNLRGPSINVQTACSSSLVAVHQAMQSLLAGECDLALAGGVTIELPHRRGYLYQEREILSPDGHCYAFDQRAQGTVFGSGAAVVVLRRLQDAIDAGDPIYAVIKGSAVNNDGARKAGYLAPSVDGQAAAIAEALAVAAVSADSIGYIECHGTGTYLGDPIEVAALTQAFRQGTQRKGFCQIGSVKTNIGHLDTAAGAVGLIKVCLALKHRQIPPSLNFDQANPTIDFEASPFRVARALSPFPSGPTPARGAVNSLGVGGTNAHVILEQAPATSAAPKEARPQLLALSARSAAALDAQAARLVEYLKAHPELDLADVSYTLLRGRKAFARRRVLSASTLSEAVELLTSGDAKRVHNVIGSSDEPRVAFMFPGGGAQYVNMAKGLYETEPVVRTWIDRGLSHLETLANFKPRLLLFPAPGTESAQAQALLTPSRQLPLIFIVEYALAQLWLSLGVQPTALIGHSLGENTAAAVAGVMTFEEGIGLVLKRGQLFDGVAPGAMLSVPLSQEALAARLPKELDLACVNAPNLCVVSGPRGPLETFQRALLADEIEARSVPIDIAAHSRMLDPILEEFRAHLRTLKLRPPTLPIHSNRTGAPLTAAEATSPDYWVDHLRSTVHFASGIEALARDPGRVFLEVGPGRVLGSLARQCRGVSAQGVLQTLRHSDDAISDDSFLVTTQGRLWALGHKLKDETLWKHARRRLHLPTYAFQRQNYWIDAAPRGAVGQAAHLPLKEGDPEQWIFDQVWLRRDQATRQAGQSVRWLIFLDTAELGEKIREQLTARGDTVICVQDGDTFQKLSNQHYRLSYEQGLPGYEALVSDLLASGNVPTEIVHLALVTDRPHFRPGSSFFHTNQERGFYSLLLLTQALAGLDYPTPLQLTVVTSGMQRVGKEPLLHPEKSTVLGPCLVLPRELPGVTCRVVDLELEQHQEGLQGWLRETPTFRRARSRTYARLPVNSPLDVEEAAARLLQELDAIPGNEQVAVRRDGRYVRELERRRLGYGQGVPLREKGVYLITGGLGGIGLTLAGHLASRYKARLVLLGRRKLPPREQYSAYVTAHPNDATSGVLRSLLAMEAAGAEVLVQNADVTNVERMAAVVAQAERQFGPIQGVIHAAGTLRDHPMLGKEQEDIDAVLAPKVYGTLVLRQVLAHRTLDFLVLFSSTSAVLAPPGQVDYVAANAFLNAVAAQARGTSEHVLSLGWGVWQDVGMAAAQLRASHDVGQGTQTVRHPLLQESVPMPQGGWELRTTWKASEHWALDEHRTAEREALLPGTGYLELLRGAMAHVAPGQSVELEDVLFLSPLWAPDQAAIQVAIQLKPNPQGYDFTVASARAGEATGGLTANAEGRVSLLPLAPPPALDLAAIEARCTQRRHAEGRTSLQTGQAAHLDFGPRWQVLRSMAIGDKEALAKLALPEDYRGDLESFALHPALMDLATGYAMDLIAGYTGRELWVPVSYRSVKIHRPLSANAWSWVRLNRDSSSEQGLASFDVCVTDAAGNVCVEVEHFTIKRLGDSTLLATPASGKRVSAPLESIRQSAPSEISAQQAAFEHNVSQGISAAEGIERFERVLSAASEGELLVSSLDLRALASQLTLRKAAPSAGATTFSRPLLDSDFAAPKDDIERTLVEYWQELLGLDRVGVKDNFFELGGHSLVALRLFAKIKRTYRVDYPMSVLFEAPTIEKCADLLRAALGRAEGSGTDADAPPPSRPTRYQHLVRMDSRAAAATRPFFLVAGMFGNVLNLRHLASLLGNGRPCYGLQARGLYGATAPHETFEEMAKDYLAEIRTVQPQGPYLLGGFSGGGIAAFEMARQLIENGETVSMLVMLDTPIPSRGTRLSLTDKVQIRATDLRSEGLSLVTHWVRDKLDHRAAERMRKELLQRQLDGQSQDFNSQRIEAAFYRALGRYELRALPIDVALFRPKFSVAYQLRDGRRLNAAREPLIEDNGWGPWTRSVRVLEVPGDHDSMVLEPNVRVLATELGRCIEQSDPGIIDLSVARHERGPNGSGSADAGSGPPAASQRTPERAPAARASRSEAQP